MSDGLLTLASVAELREQVRQWRSAGETLAFVPTMGNLHAGHLRLLEVARESATRNIVSIFVNPLQFGAGEDFASYPRTLQRDHERLQQARLDLLFAPTVAEVYPRGQQEQTRVEVPGLSDILCGESRPGHFVGVATVVCKLLNMVQPDLALFGEKDYQQLLVIRRLVDDLDLPVRVIGVATVREADGLAMSSRNSYLSESDRRLAPLLYRCLQQTARAIETGRSDYAALEQAAKAELQAAGFRPEYFSVRRAGDLAPPEAEDQALRILAAAYLGRARLIDNLPASRNGLCIDR